MSVQPKTIAMIQVVAKALGELNDQAVFVGGATVPFYIPEVYWPQARPTDDIDLVMRIFGKIKNANNEELLRSKGFQHDTSEGAPLCRWVYQGINVDIMSTDDSVFGFTNVWYKEGVANSIEIMSEPVSIKIFSLPYFLATKIEAFKSRGRSDYMGSSDMEDIISVLDVAPEQMLENKLPECSAKLRNYFDKELINLQKSPSFIDALAGAIFSRENSPESEKAIMLRIQKLVDLLRGPK